MKYWRIDINREYKLVDAVAEVTDSKRQAKRLIDEGLVSVNGVRELRYRRPLRKGSVIEFCFNPKLFKSEKPQLLYREEGVLVVNKPPFINSNLDRPNLEEVLRRALGKEIFVVHRLDKQTSGAILAVEEAELFEKFKELFKKREVKKEYLTVVAASPNWKKRRIEKRLDGKEAITELTVVERFKRGALLRAEIPTGRKHQIRRHLSLTGLPIAGEFTYWKRALPFPFTLSPRILLHSQSLEFNHPVTGKRVKVEAPLPEDFQLFLNDLREWSFKVNELTL